MTVFDVHQLNHYALITLTLEDYFLIAQGCG